MERSVGTKLKSLEGFIEASTLWNSVATLFDKLNDPEDQDEDDVENLTGVSRRATTTGNLLLSRFETLKNRLDSLELGSRNVNDGGLTSADVSTLLNTIVSLQNKVKNLEKKGKPNEVGYGGIHFEDPRDARVWAKENMSIDDFGLIVDDT